MKRRSVAQLFSVNARLTCIVAACTWANVTFSQTNSVDVEQVRLATSVGAQCAGYYDGLYALVHNLDEAKSHVMLTDLKSVVQGLSKQDLFEYSTASIIMTKGFIALLNQTVKPATPYTLESFREDYVGFRRQSMAWKNTDADNRYIDEMHQQCERVLSISYGNGTLTDEQVSAAVKKRAHARGVELEN